MLLLVCHTSTVIHSQIVRTSCRRFLGLREEMVLHQRSLYGREYVVARLVSIRKRPAFFSLSPLPPLFLSASFPMPPSPSVLLSSFLSLSLPLPLLLPSLTFSRTLSFSPSFSSLSVSLTHSLSLFLSLTHSRVGGGSREKKGERAVQSDNIKMGDRIRGAANLRLEFSQLDQMSTGVTYKEREATATNRVHTLLWLELNLRVSTLTNTYSAIYVGFLEIRSTHRPRFLKWACMQSKMVALGAVCIPNFALSMLRLLDGVERQGLACRSHCPE